MSRNISEIYKEYKIPPSLQEHMFRVAAVAYLICDSIEVPVDRETIITSCLLHDMGNIIKFKMDVMPQLFEPEGVDYWQKIKDEYVRKYSTDEHEATIKIVKELGMSDRVGALVDQIKFSLLCSLRDENDFDIKIIHYSDGRVDPHGVVSYEERMNEAKIRYANKNGSIEGVTEERREELVACGVEIEKQIFSKCKIRPEDINNDTVTPVILRLRNFMVK